MSSGKKKDKAHPWRDNIEAVTVSIVIIVLFKYFVLEAYKIPTGSMQPTLMGWDDPSGGGIKDRVLVDKLSYHYRDPERFEIVVFKYPLDRSKNFIKRIVGMPGEVLEVRDGDLFHGPDEDHMTVLRRPRPIQRAQLKRLANEGEWKLAAPWSIEGDEIDAPGPGRASFPKTSSSVRDVYTDGYPGKLGRKLQTVGKRSGDNAVGDLRLECRVKAGAELAELRIELREATRTYTLRFPGPAAAADARPTIDVRDGLGEIDALEAAATKAWRLPKRSVRIAAQNLDDLLQLEVDGDVVATLEIPAVPESVGSGVTIETVGGGARMTSVRVYRDIFYTTAGQKRWRWSIPEKSYVMLGDNTQDSSDGRDWSLSCFAVADGEGGEQVVRGNQRNGENPVYSIGPGGSRTIFFYDELGERWVFPQSSARHLESAGLSFVPRELIRGRAVLVVWPMAPSLDVYRLQWVR